MGLIRKIKKILIILIVLFTIGINTVNASIWQTAKDWLNLGERERAQAQVNQSAGEFENLAATIWGAGIFVVLIVGTAIGIKIMLSSPEEKAKSKESLIPYAIGTVIIVGASGIWALLVNVLEEISH